LSYREKELEVTDTLRHAGTGCRGTALQQLRGSSLKAHERRRIDSVSQIEAYGPHWCPIPNAESHGLRGVVEILVVALAEPERDAAERTVNISQVVEKHTLDILPDERETQFHIIKK
jgi:hypothetical protein